RVAEAIVEFRKATAANSSLLGATLDLIWRSSGSGVDQVQAVAGDDPRLRLTLAQFLLRQSRVQEAAIIFGGVDRHERLRSPETSAFLRILIDTGRYATAHDLWLDTVGSEAGRPSLIWNGGFEAEAVSNLSEFDWNLSKSPYARIAISS